MRTSSDVPGSRQWSGAASPPARTQASERQGPEITRANHTGRLKLDDARRFSVPREFGNIPVRTLCLEWTSQFLHKPNREEASR